MRDKPQASLLASPILIGAVTALVATVAVFLSYNANNGLPFVPTYDLTAQVRDAAGLVRGNEIRVGGKRVGIITSITAQEARGGRPLANIAMKLDRTVEPLYSGAQITIRPRSPLGLKYIELVPARTGKPLPQHGTLAVTQARPAVDLDAVLGMFDQSTRRSLQLTVAGLGTGLAGRGADFNETLAAAPELLQRFENVAANLSDPRTGLRGFVDGLDRTAAQLAPVAPQLGSLVRGADLTARALAGVRPEIEQTLAGLPPTEAIGASALATATPVLHDARLLVHDIRPGTQALPLAARRLHAALQVGIPVLRRASDLSQRLRDTLTAVEQLSSDPLTVGALNRLLATVNSALPTLRFALPAQTVCNYLGLWTRNVDSTISEGDDSGTWFRTLVVVQPDEGQAQAKPVPNLHVNPYPNTAAPGQTPECEAGNEPYKAGQSIGHAPGNQGLKTELTYPPPEVRGK
jgi:virulence factor Mce-like protein